jgi:hypothetical protein
MTPAGFRLDREQQVGGRLTPLPSLHPGPSPKVILLTAAIATIVSCVHYSGTQPEEGSLEASLCGLMSYEEALLWLQYMEAHRPQVRGPGHTLLHVV